MRVLMLSHLFPRPAEPEQAPFIRRQVEELRARGVEIRVLSPVPWAPPLPGWSARLRRTLSRSRSTPREWAVDGLRVEAPRYLKLPGALDAGWFGPLYYLGVRRRVLRLYREVGFDMIHGQMLIPDGYAAARLGRELGVPTVATERGYIAKYPNRWPWSLAMRRTLRELDGVITVSRAIREMVREFREPAGFVRVVHTGTDLEQFRPILASDARSSLGLSDGHWVVCIARLEATKDPLGLVAAFKHVALSDPEARLAWVGGGSLLREVKAAVSAAGLEKRFILAGSAPHAQIPTWLGAADVVVLNSRNEGLPNCLVEAAASGRPVVATRVGGIPEVVDDGVTGLLVKPADPGTLAAALEKLLRDKALAEQMGAAARRFVASRFSWDRHAEEMLGIYRDVVARRAPGAAGPA